MTLEKISKMGIEELRTAQAELRKLSELCGHKAAEIHYRLVERGEDVATRNAIALYHRGKVAELSEQISLGLLK